MQPPEVSIEIISQCLDENTISFLDRVATLYVVQEILPIVLWVFITTIVHLNNLGLLYVVFDYLFLASVLHEHPIVYCHILMFFYEYGDKDTALLFPHSLFLVEIAE
jgi:hypothetical protein